MSLLVIYKILGLLVNTLTTDDKYPLLNSGNLTKPIQMQRSKKEKNCFYFFFYFFKSRSHFEQFQKKICFLKLIYFGNYRLRNTCSDKYLKGPISQDPSTTNMLNDPKHCWNLNDSTFIMFIEHCEIS